MSAIRDIASGIVDRDVIECKVGGAIDREPLNRGVLLKWLLVL